VADAPGLDHALLAERECDERAQLDELVLRELLANPGPEGVVDPLRVPDQVARVEERRLLPFGKTVRPFEV